MIVLNVISRMCSTKLGWCMMENPGTSSRLVSAYQPKPAALSPLASKALKRGKNRSITWLVHPPALHLLFTHLPGLGLVPLPFSLQAQTLPALSWQWQQLLRPTAKQREIKRYRIQWNLQNIFQMRFISSTDTECVWSTPLVLSINQGSYP